MEDFSSPEDEEGKKRGVGKDKGRSDREAGAAPSCTGNGVERPCLVPGIPQELSVSLFSVNPSVLRVFSALSSAFNTKYIIVVFVCVV